MSSTSSEAYDGVWASACLLHVPKDELEGILRPHPPCAEARRRVLRQLQDGRGDGRDTLGRYYNYPSAEWLRATYAAAGEWSSLSSDTSVIKSFDETPATMLHLVVRKAASDRFGALKPP